LLCLFAASVACFAGLDTLPAKTSWPADVPDFQSPERGEHPRLLFRQSDLPALRERAKTPEGKAIIQRLRKLLNGSDGESMPTAYNPNHGKQSKDGSGPTANAPVGMYTISHTAGFGFLYQITGDKKYADLGRQCMEKAFDEYRDRDNRYSFKYPYGALRSGPSLGWTALGYDLCYDGWDEDYRKKVALAIQDYDEGKNMSLEELVRGSRHMPASNHWGMQVGGGALAVLAIMNDPGVDMKKIEPLLATSQKSMIRNMTEGFGDGGFFAEGDGTGSMSSQIAFIPAWLSEDEGKTWQGGLMLDERKGNSYPDGFQAPDGRIYVSYNRNRATDGEILLAQFTEQDIIAGKLAGPKSKLKMFISRPLAR